MKLHWSSRSPYVRKVMVAAHELELADRITRVRSVTAITKPNPVIMADNPLNKIPTLVLETGEALIDSDVIIEYLDALAGGGVLIPSTGPERWHALSQQALASGVLDLLILWRYEREKPAERQTPEWLSAFALKVAAAFDRFEQIAAEMALQPFHVGHIALGCALSYADFRFATLDWRATRPALAAWYITFAARPSAQASEFVDA